MNILAILLLGITSKAFRSGPSAEVAARTTVYYARCRSGHAQDVTNVDKYLVVNAHDLAVGGLALCDYNRRPFTSVKVFAASLDALRSSLINSDEKAKFENFFERFFNTRFTLDFVSKSYPIASCIVASFLR